MQASIWTIEGRMERTGVRVTSERLETLKKKRDGQLKRLIEKYAKKLPKKVNRWKDRLCH